jgi:hypothetical protein
MNVPASISDCSHSERPSINVVSNSSISKFTCSHHRVSIVYYFVLETISGVGIEVINSLAKPLFQL